MNMHELLKKSLAAFVCAALVLPSAPALAADAAAPSAGAQLQGVTVADDMVTIKLSTAVLYNSFLTQTPPRLVMELLDVEHAGASTVTQGKGRFLKDVRTSQYEREPRKIARVVLDLVKMAGYKVATTASGLTVSLVGSVEGGDKSAAAPAGMPSAPLITPKRVVAKRAAQARKPAPVAKLDAAAEKPADPAPAAAEKAEAPAPVEEAPAAAPRPKVYISATPLEAMRAAGLDKTMSKELAVAARVSDVSKTKADAGDDKLVESDERRSGLRAYRDLMTHLPRDPVSYDFDNTDVRDVIRMLQAKAKFNIVYGPDVNGTLTLHLEHVPFSEAFRTVLSMMKLTTDQVGDNVLRVITPAELTKQRTSSTAITRLFTLNYAKASEVKPTIDAVRQAEGRTSGNSSVDMKTNAIIVTDTLEGLLATENLIAQLDQRPRQVLIEAKLVEVNLNNQLNYGVQWDYLQTDQGRIGGKQGVSAIGSTLGFAANQVTPTQDYSRGVAANLDPSAFIPSGGNGRGTGVSLTADRAFGALTLGRVTNNFILNATLNAAASEGKAKVLSEPKVATLNNQAANINVTTQIPYVTSNVASTGVQTQTVNYVTTGIQLTVTPSINADGRITLSVAPTVSQPSATASASTQTGAPAVDARTANTTVLVRDGETIVIGGLISDSLQDTISKIPFFGDIPVLGWLFKKKTKIRTRTELLIFVTTRILPD